MAEGGGPPRKIVNFQPVFHIHGLSLDDTTTIVHGDQQIGSRTNIRAREIGVVGAPQVEDPVAQDQAEAEEENVIEGVEQMNLTETQPDSIPKPKQIFKASILADRALILITKSDDYEGAVKLLEDPSIGDDVHANLTLAECYLHLGQDWKAVKTIDIVRNILMTSSGLKASDVYSYANDAKNNSFHIRAMILFRIASDTLKATSPSPDDVIEKIRKCAFQLSFCLNSLIEVGSRSRDIALDYGVKYMSEMASAIRSVRNVSSDDKALRESHCLNLVGICYNDAKEYDKALKHYQTGIEVLENQFRSNASKYKYYGDLLNNIGSAYVHTENHILAEKYWVKALGAVKQKSEHNALEV